MGLLIYTGWVVNNSFTDPTFIRSGSVLFWGLTGVLPILVAWVVEQSTVQAFSQMRGFPQFKSTLAISHEVFGLICGLTFLVSIGFMTPPFIFILPPLTRSEYLRLMVMSTGAAISSGVVLVAQYKEHSTVLERLKRSPEARPSAPLPQRTSLSQPIVQNWDLPLAVVESFSQLQKEFYKDNRRNK